MTNLETTNPIIESLSAQIEPAKAAIADRWIRNAKRQIAKIQENYDVMPSLENEWKLCFGPQQKNGFYDERVANFKKIVDEFFTVDTSMYGTKETDEEYFARRDKQVAEYGREVRGFYVPKSDETLQKMADKYAEACWIAYIAKMENKFSKINATSVKIKGQDPLWNELIVEANNGVEFVVSNSIILKVSERGLWFNQFPARFGKVRQNGVAVKGAASQKAVERLTA